MVAQPAPHILVAPKRPALILDAVRQGGAILVDDGGPADGLVWVGPVGPEADDLRRALSRHRGIRWAQLPMAGIERVVEAGILSDPRWKAITWTCAKGTFARPVAEHALALALAGLRALPVRSRARSWGPEAGTSLYGAAVTVLGGGGITTELLRLLAPFEVQATVVRRSAGPVAGAARTVTTADLHSVLSEALVVFVALALSPATAHIISERELRLMDADAWLVNVARGRHVDTEALVSALRQRTIGGAALDVTDPEPLPEGHALWSLPNCLITPHSANTEKMSQPLLADRIRQNVQRFCAGLPLVGLVDPVAGY